MARLRIAQRLEGVKRIFLDTSPIIYLVEKNERYLEAVLFLFKQIDEGLLHAVTSPVTLTECLVLPYRQNRRELAQYFLDLLINDSPTTLVPIGQEIALEAAKLRAHYNLTLSDAFQLATCLSADCDAFLTNDLGLKRIKEANIIVLQELV